MTARPSAKVRAMRPQLAGEQGWRCCWCGCRMRPEPGHADSATIEHIEPLSRGGSNQWFNLASACWTCNTRRNALSLDEALTLGTDPAWGSKQRRQMEITP
jgi:5-methylcytosine-specific restriction endonuclease McrA